MSTMKLTSISLTPAYGRDYKTPTEVFKDWSEGKDFRMHTPQGSTYCSVRDLELLKEEYGVETLSFHYDKRSKLVCLNTNKPTGCWTPEGRRE